MAVTKHQHRTRVVFDAVQDPDLGIILVLKCAECGRVLESETVNTTGHIVEDDL